MTIDDKFKLFQSSLEIPGDRTGTGYGTLYGQNRAVQQYKRST